MKIYDLHSHSLKSDGKLAPSALVQRAHEKGVDFLALTDHDITDGIDEALAAAQELALTLIPGVEISATWENRTLHVVGLNIDMTNTALQTGLSSIREQRAARALQIGDQLAKLGIPDAHEGASRIAQGAILSRTHFAEYMVREGHAKDFSRAFRDWIGDRGKAFVKTRWAPLQDAIDWINAAGGQAVIAHPGRYRLGKSQLKKLFADFTDMGGAAMEVVSGSQKSDDTGYFARETVRHGLLASAGSDFHDPQYPWRELGRNLRLPEECTPVWKDW
ncbi:MAG: phosphatase [Gammaproteobacteria bacterium]|nr:MAG: phosphatase [Gammaproteobacteria bacterium]